MIIDKKKRLFGLINLLDLVVLLLIIAIVGFGFMRMNKHEQIVDTNIEKATIRVIATDVTQGLVDALEVGDELVFSVKGSTFGKIVSFEPVPYRELASGADGETYYIEVEGKYNVNMVIEADVKQDAYGFMVSGNQIYIGQENRLKSRICVFDTLVDGIDAEK